MAEKKKRMGAASTEGAAAGRGRPTSPRTTHTTPRTLATTPPSPTHTTRHTRQQQKKNETEQIRTLVARGLGNADAVLVGDVGVLGVSELQAGDPPVAGDVVDLLADLRVGEGGQEGEGLEELVCRSEGWGGGGEGEGGGERRKGGGGGKCHRTVWVVVCDTTPTWGGGSARGMGAKIAWPPFRRRLRGRTSSNTPPARPPRTAGARPSRPHTTPKSSAGTCPATFRAVTSRGGGAGGGRRVKAGGDWPGARKRAYAFCFSGWLKLPPPARRGAAPLLTPHPHLWGQGVREQIAKERASPQGPDRALAKEGGGRPLLPPSRSLFFFLSCESFARVQHVAHAGAAGQAGPPMLLPVDAMRSQDLDDRWGCKGEAGGNRRGWRGQRFSARPSQARPMSPTVAQSAAPPPTARPPRRPPNESKLMQRTVDRLPDLEGGGLGGGGAHGDRDGGAGGEGGLHDGFLVAGRKGGEGGKCGVMSFSHFFIFFWFVFRPSSESVSHTHTPHLTHLLPPLHHHHPPPRIPPPHAAPPRPAPAQPGDDSRPHPGRVGRVRAHAHEDGQG